MLFFKRSSSSRFIAFSLFLIFVSLLIYSAYAQTVARSEVSIISSSEAEQPEYEGYEVLDEDGDAEITEEDLYLLLEEINQQVAEQRDSLTYLRNTYGLDFTITPLRNNDVIRTSTTQEEYSVNLATTRTELEQLTGEINTIQHQIGDMDWNDPEVGTIKEDLAAIGQNIFYANWYVGAR